LIEGPGGIGKTALVDRFLADSSDGQVLRASGEETESLLAYGVVDQLFRFAAAAGSPADAGRGSSEGHYEVGGKLLDVLSDLQQRGPVIVLIDDLQWVDRPSMNALLFALRQLLAGRVLALLVARTEVADRLPEGLGRLTGSEGARNLQVQGLEATDLRELAELIGVRPFSLRAAQRLRQHTEGNPLHARALLAEVPTEAWESFEVSLPAPRSFAVLVLSRRAHCSAEAQRLLDAAAVLGMHCSLDTAARLSGNPDPLQALEETTAAGLLQQSEPASADKIVFAHPLLRAAIYSGLGTVARASLHTRASDLAGDQVSSLRHRVAAAPGINSQLSVALAEFARSESDHGAWASGAAHLVKASRLCPTKPEREQMLVDAVNLMLFAGNIGEAATFREEITTLAGGARRDSVLGQLAMLLGGRPIEAEQLLASAWEQCDPVRDADLAATIALQSAVHVLGRFRAMEGAEWARRAIRLTTQDSIRLPARSLLSLGLAYAGNFAEAYTALGSSDATGGSAAEVWTMDVRGMLRLVEDDLPNARVDLALAATTALRQGSQQAAVHSLGYLAATEYYSGAWDDGMLHAERAVLIASESERPNRTWLPGAVVALPAALGNWALAEEYAQVSAMQASTYEASIADAALAAAHLADARSDHQGVVRALEPVVGLKHRDGVDEPGFWPWQDLYAEALVSLRRVAEADAFLRPHELVAAVRGRRSMMARLARVRGRIAAAEGRSEEAEAAFESALQHLEQLQMPFDQARIQMAYGAFLRRLGRRHLAAEQLLAAQANLIRLGAEPCLARCDRELVACGLWPAKRRGRDRTRLTPQERSVASLVASGLSNREVADQLVLSTKTIEFHLSQIFRKLDITTRRQIAKHLLITEGT
jgi:ATP/maltotriose-dependent transcriptional regulator MalT